MHPILFIAFCVHAALHVFRADLLLYRAVASFSLTHGSLTRSRRLA